MRRVMVRYRVKADRVAEHEGYVRAVFEELARTAPAGIRYGAYRQADGVSFVHIAFVAAEKNPLDAVAAFKSFLAGIKDRCDEPPVTVELTELGSYAL